MTLAELYDRHIELRALPIAIYKEDGSLHFIGRSGLFFKFKLEGENAIKNNLPDGTEILVLAPN